MIQIYKNSPLTHLTLKDGHSQVSSCEGFFRWIEPSSSTVCLDGKAIAWGTIVNIASIKILLDRGCIVDFLFCQLMTQWFVSDSGYVLTKKQVGK